MRSLKDNSNIIKSFMVNGAIDFYFPYYFDGEDFIKQIQVEKEDLENAIMFANEAMKDYENGLIDESDAVIPYVKRIILNGLVELETEEPTSNELTLYQYIADIIIGHPNIMYELIAHTERDGEIEEFLEMAEFEICCAIIRIFVAMEKIAKIEEKEAS